MKINFKLTKKQHKVFFDNSKELLVVSGLASGKSEILLRKFILQEVLKYPKALHCFASLSYSLLRDASIQRFQAILQELGIKYKFNKSEFMFLVGKSETKVIFRSLEVAEKMRSVEIGSLYIDEAAYAKKDDFNTFLGRLRDKNGSCRLVVASTPNGFNWLYDYFVLGNRKIIKMSTYDNPFLPAGYLQMLEESYDEQLQKQELKGEFINLSSFSVYSFFDREKHVKVLSDRVSFCGLDFNVDPFCGVFGYSENDTIYITDELYLRNSNTIKAREEIAAKYSTDVFLIPDATGSARRTSASKSDHELLREYGFQVARTRNPFVKDRRASVNNLLNKGRIIISPDCKNLIKDLEQLQQDNKNDMLSHISDALGYVCYYFFPLSRNRRENKTPKFR
jgi:PBSX family phage terminase large subunit